MMTFLNTLRPHCAMWASYEGRQSSQDELRRFDFGCRLLIWRTPAQCTALIGCSQPLRRARQEDPPGALAVQLCATRDTRWRNRAEFLTGRDQASHFLQRKWARELEYRLIKEECVLSVIGARRLTGLSCLASEAVRRRQDNARWRHVLLTPYRSVPKDVVRRWIDTMLKRIRAHKMMQGRLLAACGLFAMTVMVAAPPSLSRDAAAGRRYTIPVKIIDHEVVMAGYVNHSSKINVALDTGSSVSVIAPKLAARLHLSSTAARTVNGVGQPATAHVISGVRLAWGPGGTVALPGQTMIALPIRFISQETGYPVSGIFGSTVFQHFRVRVDYQHREVTFASGAARRRSGVTIPIKIYGGVPYVKAAFETAHGKSVPALFILDSGTAGDLLLDRQFLAAHPSIARGHSLARIPTPTAVGGAIPTRVLRIVGITLGPFHLVGPVAAVPDKVMGALRSHDVAGFIGAGILSRFTVEWNYRDQTMSLTPNRRYGSPFETDTSGVRLVAEGPSWRTIQVAAVAPGSAAAQAGVHPGDRLEKVNGAAPPPLYEVTKLLSRAGTSVVLTVLRAGKPHTITVHVRALR